MTAVLVVAALFTGTATSWAALSFRPWSIPADDVQVVACQISWNSYTRQPSRSRSTQNPCNGVWRVSLDWKGRILVEHTSNAVIGVEVTSNEATVGRRITAGASGGGSTTTLTVHDARLGRAPNLTIAADARRMGSGAGFWLRLTHDDR